MNNQLSENEKRIVNILNLKDDLNDIWMPVRELVDKVDMDIHEIEQALYLLQIRRLVRVSMDEFGAIKLTTEEKVAKKINSRVDSAIGSMQEVQEESVEEEEYEEAAKLRDWILMARDPDKKEELIKSLLDDIDNEED